MKTLTDEHHARLKRSLVRLVHVLLTHSGDKSESKEEFCQRCAWDVEVIIDQIENPPLPNSARQIGSVAERIHRRIEARPENDWADYPEFFEGPARIER